MISRKKKNCHEDLVLLLLERGKKEKLLSGSKFLKPWSPPPPTQTGSRSRAGFLSMLLAALEISALPPAIPTLSVLPALRASHRTRSPFSRAPVFAGGMRRTPFYPRFQVTLGRRPRRAPVPAPRSTPAAAPPPPPDPLLLREPERKRDPAGTRGCSRYGARGLRTQFLPNAKTFVL